MFMKLTKSLEDYIEAIYMINENGNVRLRDVAQKLEVKLPSANQALNKLSEEKLIHYEKYGNIKLTVKGEKTAKEVYKKHEALYKFLTEILGVDKKIAQKEACEMEHCLSTQTIKKLIKFLKNRGS